jgi:hypothetical protein
MDESLRQDAEHKLHVLTEIPDLDLHVRVQEHRLEGYVLVERPAVPAHGCA